MDRKLEKDRTDEIIGRNIRLEREARRMTRGELAKIMEISPSHVGLIERGARGMTSVSLSILSNAFDISIDEFFVSKRRGGESVRDEGSAVPSYRKKVNALLASLNEAELEFTVNTIKGVIAMNAAQRD